MDYCLFLASWARCWASVAVSEALLATLSAVSLTLCAAVSAALAMEDLTSWGLEDIGESREEQICDSLRQRCWMKNLSRSPIARAVCTCRLRKQPWKVPALSLGEGELLVAVVFMHQRKRHQTLALGGKRAGQYLLSKW
ncbi:hypothetical protein BASA81_001299 [Batrachochytrium salamandrivorans]|nr:hypothetical protein BASA81_001299 [Batrachochytrium salamandrivorans]